jgi:hypothetical protein
LTYFWDHPKWKWFALTTYTSLPNLGTFDESMWNVRPWPTSADLKPMNHVSNSSFMRRDYQKCFTYDMSHMFHGYQVPNSGIMKRFYIFLNFLKFVLARSRLGQNCCIHGTSVGVEPWWSTCVSMMKQHVGDSKLIFSKKNNLYSMVLQFKFSHDFFLLTKVWPNKYGCTWAFHLKQNSDLGIIWCPVISLAVVTNFADIFYAHASQKNLV